MKNLTQFIGFVNEKSNYISNLDINWNGPISYSLFKKDTNITKLDENIPLITEFDFLKYACIYCNIIEDQYFGNKLSPILKMITIDKSSNSLVKNLENLHNVNVNKSWIFFSQFRRFFNWVVPLFKKHALPKLKDVGKVVGKEMLSSVGDISKDIVNGVDIKTASS